MPPEDNKTTRQTWWWTQDGVMHSAWKLAVMEFAVSAIDMGSRTEKDCLRYFMDVNHESEIPQSMDKFLERPGTWYLMSGMSVVHEDDLYPTRESAAQALYEKLIKIDPRS